MATKIFKLTILLIVFNLFIPPKALSSESANSTATAYSHPLFEWGFLVGHGMLADYPASNEYRYLTIPTPYLSYHGEIFETDEQEGTRFRIIRNPNFDFDLSFGGSFPTETDGNQARQGMPPLDWTLEIGPRLLYYLYKKPQYASIRLGLPLRTSFSTNFNTTKNIGYLFTPSLQIDRFNFLIEGLDLYFDLTFNYLSEGEADYFYEIQPQYQTTERSSYNAKAGFLNWQTSLGTQIEWDQKILILGVQYSDLSNSVNKDSFLHKSDQNWSYLIGFGWILYSSEEKAVRY